MQSPIEIEQVQVSRTVGELERHYNAAPTALLNSGHAIAVSCCFSLYLFDDQSKSGLKSGDLSKLNMIQFTMH